MKKIMLIIIMAIGMGFISGGQGYAQTVVEGEITSDTTWSSDILLRAPVFVRKPATLTVQAGVVVKGEKATLGALIIDQGAKLIAIGTENNPVVFTSDQPEGQRKRADWGGLIINGYTPLNLGTVGYGEGDTGYYGCDQGLGIPCNEQDNSGTLRYVRCEYAGIQFSPDNEMNGIAFQGTGSGTTVDHVQVHHSKDDGIEMFGGLTNIKYAMITGCADDSFDWTHGYRGNVQFVVVQHQCDTGDCDKGMEADNLDKNYDALPRSKPTMYNFTLIGDPINGSQTVSTNGMLLRRGTAATIRNFIVQGFNRSGIDIDNTPTMLNAQNGEITVSNSIWWMNANNNMNFYDDADDLDVADYPFTTNQFMTGMMQNNVVVNPLLPNPYDWTDPDFQPAANSPAGNGQVPVAAPPQGNTFIVATNYMGAIDPNGDDWTRKPWTTFGPRQGESTTTTIANTTTSTVNSTSTTTVFNTTTTVLNATTTVSNTTTTVPNTTTTVSGSTTTSVVPGSTTTTVPQPPPECIDNDKDGYAIEGGTCGAVDCADNDAAINPGAEEVCRDKKDNNCNGEIDEDCKLCASSQMLGAENPQLDILRQYRDTVMQRSLKGRVYTKLYYFYSDQVSAILEADPALKAQATALLASALPAVNEALESNTVVLTDAQKQQTLAVLNKIGKKSSFVLRLLIVKLKSDIRSGSVL